MITNFYTDLLLPIIQTACAGVPVNGQSVGYPTALHSPPWLCHIFDGIDTTETAGHLTFVRYTTIHRLHVQWQAFDVAEQTLITTSNALVQTLTARSKLSLFAIPSSGLYVGESFTLSPLTTGFVTVGAVQYRIADIRSTLGIKVNSTYWSQL